MLLSISIISPAIPIRSCFASLSVPAQQNKLHSSRVSKSSPSFSYAKFVSRPLNFVPPVAPLSSFQERRRHWKIALALDTGGFASNGSQEDGINGDSGGIGQTRLSRILIAGGRQLLGKLNSARKNFPMKVFLLLLGFYTANALATILGQTGDWDVLVAGVVVAAIEGIGMLMYKRPPTSSSTGNETRLQSLISFLNYWKAGICLGLFVDAFKLGS